MSTKPQYNYQSIRGNQYCKEGIPFYSLRIRQNSERNSQEFLIKKKGKKTGILGIPL